MCEGGRGGEILGKLDWDMGEEVIDSLDKAAMPRMQTFRLP